MIKVLFVCMGNICRSPTAEGVFRRVLQDRNMEASIVVSSAGTHGYHVGDSPDRRAQQAAARRGYDLSRIRARKVSLQDLMDFDMVLAMDRNNLSWLQGICPAECSGRLDLLMHYSRSFSDEEVPDPYYGGGEGFDRVLDMVEDAAQGLADHIRDRLIPAVRGAGNR